MRYWLNVYWAGFVYLSLRFYTAWAVLGRSVYGNFQPDAELCHHGHCRQTREQTGLLGYLCFM
jgi:hypothetical protein